MQNGKGELGGGVFGVLCGKVGMCRNLAGKESQFIFRPFRIRFHSGVCVKLADLDVNCRVNARSKGIGPEGWLVARCVFWRREIRRLFKLHWDYRAFHRVVRWEFGRWEAWGRHVF